MNELTHEPDFECTDPERDEALTRLLLGEVDAKERAELESFLADHPEANRVLEERRGAMELLRSMAGPLPSLSEAKRATILAATAGEGAHGASATMEPPLRDSRQPGWVAYSGVAAAFLLFALGMWWLPREDDQDEMDPQHRVSVISSDSVLPSLDLSYAPGLPGATASDPAAGSDRNTLCNPNGSGVLTASSEVPGTVPVEWVGPRHASRITPFGAAAPRRAAEIDSTSTATQPTAGWPFGVANDNDAPDQPSAEDVALQLAKNSAALEVRQEVLAREYQRARVRNDEEIARVAGLGAEARQEQVQLAQRFRLDARQLEEELSQVQNELEMTRRLADAKLQLAALGNAGIDMNTMAIEIVPKINGIVSAARGDIVVLSVGRQDQVRVGYEFTLYDADQYIAKVKVESLLDELCGTRILFTEPGKTIRPGLKASTRVSGADTPTTVADPTPEQVAKLVQEYEAELADQRRSQAEARVTAILQGLRRLPAETPDAMYFRYWGDNPFVRADHDPLSTFGIDVDTASHSLVRSYLRNGNLPPRAAVRTEEFVNAYASHLPPPTEQDLALHLELATSEFSHRDGVALLKVGVKAREIPDAERKPIALTIVLDVSGSMQQENRLELVKQAILTLLPELDGRDTIGIVAFSSSGRVVLEPVSALDIDLIGSALRNLFPGGSTNAQEGLDFAYAMAERQFREGSSNRVALFSDGVANTGITDLDTLLARTAEARGRGIYLNTFGCGMGNHNDTLMEQLADKGDGVCGYLDTLKEAQEHFRRNLAGTFQAVARDAKIQVEFHPASVLRYRQLGYENRAIADADFRNDAVDAGEVGAGHEVVALYEVELKPNADGPIATARVRYQSVDRDEVVEIEAVASGGKLADFHAASERFRLSAAVAAFAEVLRDSSWARQTQLAEIEEIACGLLSLDTAEDDSVAELVAMVKRAQGLIESRVRSELSQLIDEVKRNQHIRARIEDRLIERGGETGGEALKEELERLRAQNEAMEKRLRDLIIG